MKEIFVSSLTFHFAVRSRSSSASVSRLYENVRIVALVSGFATPNHPGVWKTPDNVSGQGGALLPLSVCGKGMTGRLP